MGTKKNPTSSPASPGETTAAPAAPESTLLDLFKSGGEAEEKESAEKLSKLERRNLPPLIKHDQVPVGVAVQGEIVKFVPSPSTEIKGRLIWLNHKGTDFCFPCTGTIRQALAPGLKDDDAKLDGILAKEVGSFFYAKRVANKPNKKSMFIFDVRCGKLK